MQAAIDYLKTLDLIIRPQTILSCPLVTPYRYLSQIEGNIKESEIQRLQHKYNFKLSQEEFIKAYFFEKCNIELSSPLPGIPFLCTENVSKISAHDDTIFLHGSDKNNPMHLNCAITLYFKVYYHNELLRSISTQDLQEFIKKLDMYSKCIIETTLFDNSFGSHFLYPDLELTLDKNIAPDTN